MQYNTIDKWLSGCKDYHLPISVGIFLVGSIMKWFGHLDYTYVAFTSTVLGAITGHAFSPARHDDADPDKDSKDQG